MSLQVSCPNCNTSYRVDESKLGSTATCKQCSQRFTLESGNDTSTGKANQETRVDRDPASTDQGQLGRFAIRSKFGSGAFGTVYRAYDPVLDREVALKVPHPGALESDKQKARYLREPKAAAQLRHPHIVPIFDANLDHDNLYIASAFIEGRTLKDYIEHEKPDFRTSATIVMKLAEALDYAHSKGIVHRDVKPANIMMDESGEPMLMDFGLASFQEAGSDATVYGKAIGTPAYMPPEQARGELQQIGPASDQYSLGVVLYELLTGERPFHGPPDLVVSLVQTQEPKSPRGQNPQIPKDLETICQKAMVKEVGTRFGSCEEMAADLRRWLEGEPIKARRVGHFERLARWCRRQPAIASLTVAIVAVIVIGFAGIGWQWHVARDNELKAQGLADTLRVAHDELLVAHEAEEAERVRAIEQRDIALRNSYAANFGLALLETNKESFGSDNKTEAVRKLLEDALPISGVPELRGWEWHYLNSINTMPTHSFTIPMRTTDSRFAGFPSLSPSARYTAKADNGLAEIWETASGSLVATLHNAGGVNSWSANEEKFAAVAPSDATVVTIWSVPHGRIISEFGDIDSEVLALALNTDGSMLAYALDERIVEIRATNDTDDSFKRALPVAFSVQLVTWHPESTHVAVAGGSPSRLEVFDIRTGERVKSISNRFRIGDMGWSYDGQYFAYCMAGVRPARISIYDSASWENLGDIKDGGYSLSWQSNNRWLTALNGIRNRFVKTYLIPDFVEIEYPFLSNLQSLAQTGDGKQLCTVKKIGAPTSVWRVELWENLTWHSSKTTIRTIGAGSPGTLSWSPDGTRVAIIENGSSLTLRNAVTFELVTNAPIDAKTLIWSDWNRNGDRLAVANSRSILLYDGHSAAEKVKLDSSENEILCADWHNGNEQIVSGHKDGRILFWSISKKRLARELKGSAYPITAIASSSHDTTAFGDSEGIVRTIIGEGKLRRIGAHKARIRSIAIAPDTDKLASTASDGTVKIWDVAKGNLVASWQAHATECMMVAWSPDAKRIVTAGSTDKTLRIWDPTTARELMQLTDGQFSPMLWVRWSPDGRRIAAGSSSVMLGRMPLHEASGNIYVWTSSLMRTVDR